MAYESTNPYDGTALRKFDEFSDEHLEKKIATAAKTTKPGRRHRTPRGLPSSRRRPN